MILYVIVRYPEPDHCHHGTYTKLGQTPLIIEDASHIVVPEPAIIAGCDCYPDPFCVQMRNNVDSYIVGGEREEPPRESP